MQSSADVIGVAEPDELRRRVEELTTDKERLLEAVAARDAFLAVAAHELRNPMTPIVGRVQLLRSMVGKGDIPLDTVEKKLEQIASLMARYVKRATTLLDVSRITSGKLVLGLAPVDFCALVIEVADSFQVLAEHAGSHIDVDLPQEGLTLMGDRLAFEQILDNLVSNAIKYGAGQPIAVSVATDTEHAVALIRVHDGGPGISPANQVRIFERFERAVRPGEHSGGFGVGLWIVRQLSEAMNGSIAVSCPPAAGTTFCITLPLPAERIPE